MVKTNMGIKVRAMNTIKETTEKQLRRMGVRKAMLEGLEDGVYELNEIEEDDDEFEAGDIDVIPTGGISVNCRCLVVTNSIEEAQRLIDETDPAASGCDETHLWLPRLRPL